MNKTQNLLFLLFILQIVFSSCTNHNKNPLSGKVICIDPGHGGTAKTDFYRVGTAGEREEWINLRVALKLAEILKQNDAKVILTRSADTLVSLSSRAKLAIDQHADMFISIHHNATADSTVNFPIIYFHGNASENMASVHLGKLIAKKYQKIFYKSDVAVSLISDFVIFPSSGSSVLRNLYGIPGIIGEASFFSNPQEEQRLKNEQYNQKEAQAYFLAIKEYFSQPAPKILSKYSKIKLPPFEVFQGAERMDSIALQWQKDFKKGSLLASSNDLDSLVVAESLLTRSVKSFPDSWLARDAHLKRCEILKKLGRTSEADTALKRANEFYINIIK
ncbi:MAG: N-acetylmuramoyl-L-alanine amidase [Bacteroidota bacterium]